MKAIVLTYDRCRRITEHMLKTYAVHWPSNPLTFHVPYQTNRELTAHGQRVQLVPSGPGIVETVFTLIDGLPDDEWIYWCIDDKFLIALDDDAASYLAEWVASIDNPDVCGLSFCRARAFLSPPTVSVSPSAQTPRGDMLLERHNLNHIWLHQFMRVRTLRTLFSAFPARPFAAIEMDTFTQQGPNALAVPEGDIMYVTEQNHAVLGESTVGGHLTTGCLRSMHALATPVPSDFDVKDVEIVIGSLGDVRGE